MTGTRAALPWLLALALTGANALKPPVIDDPVYLAVARQIALHPADPYGFELFWYDEPEPANDVLAPPVLPAWLGLGIRLLGERPVLLKLWLLPFAAIFAWSMLALLRRFARGLEEPLLVLTAFSPAVLPGFNFMVDLPSLGLCLASLAIFLGSLELRSGWPTVAAGLLAGLAMQTKYVAFLTPLLLLTAGCLARCAIRGAVAAAIALLLFAGWEGWVWGLYGDSHIRQALVSSPVTWRDRLEQAPWNVTLLGGVGTPLLFLAVARSRTLLAAAAAAVAAVHLALGRLEGHQDPVFSALGGLVIAAAAGLGARRAAPWLRRRRQAISRETLFLLLWVAGEVAAALALSPFPAARRVTGLTLAATLLLGRLQRAAPALGRGRAWAAVAPGVALGIAFASIDLLDSRTEPEAVRRSEAWIRARDPAPTIWFTGHWGFQYEAERRGMKPLAAGRSVLRRGEWLLVPDRDQNQQAFARDPRMGPPLHLVRIESRLPRRTLPPYYGGSRAIEPAGPLRLSVAIHRIQERWIPEKKARSDHPEPP